MYAVMPRLCLWCEMIGRCATQMPTRKVRVTAADHVPMLLAELELTPFNAEKKRTSLGKAVIWQQSQALALLHLDTRAATEAVRLCSKDAPGTSSVYAFHNTSASNAVCN